MIPPPAPACLRQAANTNLWRMEMKQKTVSWNSGAFAMAVRSATVMSRHEAQVVG